MDVDEGFAIQHLTSEKDVEQYLEITRTVFGRDSRVDLMVRKWIDYHPRMVFEDFFVAKHWGKTVACLNLIPSRWSVGGIPLRVAELACVATLPEYRNRGLQKRLIAEYHRSAAEQEFDLSVIEGIPFFYRQFGYEYALPLNEATKIRLDDMPTQENDCAHTIRPFKKEDIPEAKQLLAQAQKKYYVHSIRDEGIWRMHEETEMLAESEFEGYTVENCGKMVAYFRISEKAENKELLLREITDVNEKAANCILSFLKYHGKQRELDTLVATISHQEPFAETLANTGNAKFDHTYAWQVRALDSAVLLRKIKALFEARLAQSQFKDLSETLILNFYRYAVQMAVEEGKITDVDKLRTSEDRKMRLNPSAFVQLLLGYRSREELEEFYPDFIVKPSHKHLIDVLFPKLPSYVHTDY